MDYKFYILRPEAVSLARLIFQQLSIEDPSTGDRFFEAFGPGMPILEVSQPYERFHDYEKLLNVLNSDNPDKYQDLHKGTPFFFLGWAALDMRNYTKAVYYLDNAISEDMRSFPKSWRGTEGTNALKLIPNEHSPVYRVIKELREVLEEEVRRFNSATNNSLDVKKFIENFIFDQFEFRNGKSGRSIVTAFYTFVFEFQDRFKEVRLRSQTGGSVEPLLMHLFKGALIFESLLKYFYPYVTVGKTKKKPKTLRPIIESPELKKDFSITGKIDNSEITELKTILSSITDSTVRTAFEVTFKIRNASGHNLVWDDVFDKLSNIKYSFPITGDSNFSEVVDLNNDGIPDLLFADWKWDLEKGESHYVPRPWNLQVFELADNTFRIAKWWNKGEVYKTEENIGYTDADTTRLRQIFYEKR